MFVHRTMIFSKLKLTLKAYLSKILLLLTDIYCTMSEAETVFKKILCIEYRDCRTSLRLTKSRIVPLSFLRDKPLVVLKG